MSGNLERPSRLRLAHLITGNTADARDVLQNALPRCYLARHRVHERAARTGENDAVVDRFR